MSDTRKDQLGSFVFPNAVDIFDRLTPKLTQLGYSPDEIKSVAMDFENLFDLACGPELTQIRALAEREAWRPIESAPKDGTSILLWWRTCPEPLSGYYCVDEEYDRRQRGWVSPEAGWRNDVDECIPRNQSDCTHWRPLPAPPNTSK